MCTVPKPAFALGLVVLIILSVHSVMATYSFAGSNLYYAAGLYPEDRDTLLRYFMTQSFPVAVYSKVFLLLCSGLQNAGMKVLRVWLDGQSETQKVTIPDLTMSNIQ